MAYAAQEAELGDLCSFFIIFFFPPTLQICDSLNHKNGVKGR